MIFGPDIERLRAEAKAAVLQHHYPADATDEPPAALAARYILKAVEARRVLDGGSSDYITLEAGVWGITPAQMAERIVAQGTADDARELARMQANADIAAAKDAEAIHRVLEPLGIILAITL